MAFKRVCGTLMVVFMTSLFATTVHRAEASGDDVKPVTWQCAECCITGLGCPDDGCDC